MDIINFLLGLAALSILGGACAGGVWVLARLFGEAREAVAFLLRKEEGAAEAETSPVEELALESPEPLEQEDQAAEPEPDLDGWSIYDRPTFERRGIDPVSGEEPRIEWGIDPDTGLPYDCVVEEA